MKSASNSPIKSICCRLVMIQKEHGFNLQKSTWLTYYTIIGETATFATNQWIISISLVLNKVLSMCITHSIARSIMFSTAATEVLWISFQFSRLIFFDSEDELSPIQHTQKHSTGPVLISRNITRIVVDFITVPVTSHILLLSCPKDGLTFPPLCCQLRMGAFPWVTVLELGVLQKSFQSV